MEDIKNLKSRLAGNNAAIVFGTGVSKNVCHGALDWPALCKRLVELIQRDFGLDEDWRTDMYAGGEDHLVAFTNAQDFCTQRVAPFSAHLGYLTIARMYRTVLFEVIQEWRCEDTALPQAIITMCAGRNTPILTLNFDNLMEEGLKLAPISFLNFFEDERLNMGMLDSFVGVRPAFPGPKPKLSNRFIVHLHGQYQTFGDDATTLTDDEYNDGERQGRFVEFMTKVVTYKDPRKRSLVFIGCGKGVSVDDGDFLALWKDNRMNDSGDHYFIGRTRDSDSMKIVADVNALLEGRNTRLVYVEYGAEYNDLPGFLNSLA